MLACGAALAASAKQLCDAPGAALGQAGAQVVLGGGDCGGHFCVCQERGEVGQRCSSMVKVLNAKCV